MPIAQDRMLTLINALADTMDAFRTARQTIAEILDDIDTAKIDAATAMQQLHNVTDGMQLPEYAIACLSTEQEHFRRFEHTNRMNKERMRRLRGKPTVLSPPRRYTSSQTGYTNSAQSADDQRASAVAFMRAQSTPPIVLPPEAALPPDFEERLAQAQASYDAEQAQPKAKRLVRQDGVEVEVQPDEPAKPGKPLLG